MKLRRVLWFAALLVLDTSCAAPMATLASYAVPRINLNVYVHGENANPVEGALVKGFFYQDQVVDKKFESSHHGITNKKGIAKLSGHEELYVDLVISKDGYYKSKKRVNVKSGKDRTVDVLLRKMRNPIAMYAKKIELEIPGRGKEYGFDFFKGDLVATGYSGVHADIKIQFDRELIGESAFPDYYSQTLSIHFTNPMDGITKIAMNADWMTSEFKTGYMAPANGYVNHLIVMNARTPSGYKRKNRNIPFYIRIRTASDIKGGVNDAYYCKISPGINLRGVLGKKPLFEMTYYCNPTDNDRNMEFDPDNNMFKDM